MDPKIPSVAIVGRRNVGKSSLFNRLTEREKAIVSDIAGTTRDRTEGIGYWRGRQIRFVDTGGLDIGTQDLIDKEILKQVEFALQKSDLIFFVVDLHTGLMPQELKIIKNLQKYREKIIFVGNKADTAKMRARAEEPEWRKLKLGQPLPISAASGTGVGDLLDKIRDQFPNYFNAPPQEEKKKTKAIRIAIIGQPNVGKSSMLNAILGEERVIVSPIPHTTREPQDTEIIFEDQKIILVDTAGIRRKSKTSGLVKKGLDRTLHSIKSVDLIFFVLNPVIPPPAEDKRIASLISETRASVVILVNKWDLMPKTENQAQNWLKRMRQELPQMHFVPIILTSALSGSHTVKLLPLAMELIAERRKVIPQEEIDALLPKLIMRHKPVRGSGTKHPVIRRFEQIANDPPRFVIWVGPKQSLHFSYVRFLENRLREHFGFQGTPIIIEVRQER